MASSPKNGSMGPLVQGRHVRRQEPGILRGRREILQDHCSLTRYLAANWHAICLQNIDDLALIASLENGNALVRQEGRFYTLASLPMWFAGEAERVHREVVPAANVNQQIDGQAAPRSV
ncbi:hypothetical protein BDW66DRAFT_155609 [Aspergillus desertorum]